MALTHLKKAPRTEHLAVNGLNSLPAPPEGEGTRPAAGPVARRFDDVKVVFDASALSFQLVDSEGRAVKSLEHRGGSYHFNWEGWYSYWSPFRIVYEEESEPHYDFRENDSRTRQMNVFTDPEKVMLTALISLTRLGTQDMWKEAAILLGNPMEVFRGWSAEDIINAARWMYRSNERALISEELFDFHNRLDEFRNAGHRIAEAPGSFIPLAGVGGAEGLLGTVVPGEYRRVRAPDETVVIVDDQYRLRVGVPFSAFPEDSTIRPLLRILCRVTPRLVQVMHLSHGPSGLVDLLVGKGDEFLRRAADFLEHDSVSLSTAEELDRLVCGLERAREARYCQHEANNGWIAQMFTTITHSGSTEPPASKLYSEISSRRSFNTSAIDVEEFARTSLPKNSLVESVTAKKDGKVRIVLKEPIQPCMIQRNGKTYVEDVPGTIIAEMKISAFDLDFSSTRRGFPEAIAYADKECKTVAKHTNISSGQGRVCLGDIGTKMSEAEIAARGGFAIPPLGDFIQMLRQCNLDSAYNRSRDFVLMYPDDVTDDEWNTSRVLKIPGLTYIDVTSYHQKGT